MPEASDTLGLRPVAFPAIVFAGGGRTRVPPNATVQHANASQALIIIASPFGPVGPHVLASLTQEGNLVMLRNFEIEYY
jgi:hypothetical protein